MSGYADSEKIQYALKTALYRTMQTAMSDSASVERSAPLRVFPTNIMKVNIIEAGKGDIDENGLYVTGHTTAGQTADLSDPESTVKNYKIICPVNNVITDKTISWLVGYGSSTKSFIDGRGTSGTSYPLKQWFFRGHYSGSGESAFNAANVTYDGLQLAWNSATNGATPTEADIVPHLKYYLQVQTNYTGVSHSSSADNITYEHGLLKGLIGLDSNFVSTIMVTQGEGGPSSSASLGTSGSQAGDFWFTQPTAGVLSFYGVTNKVDASTDLATFNTKYPMISYVRYTGETGFGAGTGGGTTELISNDTNVSNMIGGTPQTMTTTSFVIEHITEVKKIDFAINNIRVGDWQNGEGLNTGGGFDNTFIGASNARYMTAGKENTVIGQYNCLNWGSNSNIKENVVIGYNNAYYRKGPMYDCVVIGKEALMGDTTSPNNTGELYRHIAIGYQAMKNWRRATYDNVAIGAYALYGSSTITNNYGVNNIAIGRDALRNTWHLSSQVAIGYGAGISANCASTIYIGTMAGAYNTNATGHSIFMGDNCGARNNGCYNIAIGKQALNGWTGSGVMHAGDANVAIGYQCALRHNGHNNVFLGSYCGNQAVSVPHATTHYNTCVGSYAGRSLNQTLGNTFIGYHAGFLHNNPGANKGYNTCVGYSSGQNISSGYSNTYMGYNSGFSTSTGFRNVAIGEGALYANSGGDHNVAIGYEAGRNATNDYNVAIGYYAGRCNGGNGSGHNNICIGQTAGFNYTSGYNNVMIGRSAGYWNTTGYNNTCIGYYAGYNITSGYQNTCIGYGAGRSINTGDENTCVGRDAGNGMTTGESNVYLGHNANYYTTTGKYNIAIGRHSGCANGNGGSEGDYKLYIGMNSTPGVTDTYGDSSYIYGYMKMNDNPFLKVNASLEIENINTGGGTMNIHGGGMVVTTQLYDFTSHTFTPCGKTGRYGPTSAECLSAYSSTSWASNGSFFSVPVDGYQLWTVPVTGTYDFIVMGGSDGWAKGMGRKITARYTLNEGDKYYICVGQQGDKGSGSGNWWASGGGGGTFVVKYKGGNLNEYTIDDVLIIAGGGGGSNASGGAVGDHGDNAPSATTSIGVSTAGGSWAANSNGGGSGAGFIGDGQGWPTDEADSWHNGLEGAGGYSGSGSGAGGFGGGGDGGGNSGGGGGGVSGGNTQSSSLGGTGGGSYFKTGYSTYSDNTGNVGHGYVTITLNTPNGSTKVGIGTTDPYSKLSFGTSAGADANWTNGAAVLAIYSQPNGSYFYGIGVGSSGSSIHSTGGLAFWGGTEGSAPSNSNCHLFIRRSSGNVGIGTTDPGQKLEVNGTILSKKLTVQGQDTTSTSGGWGGIPVLFNGYSFRNYNYFIGYNYTIHYWTSNNTSLSTASGHTSSNNDANINMRCAHGLETPRVVWYSDKRIKENIVDVSDNMALDMVRKIPCRYYNYIDKITRGTGKVIGFIAQEVREFFPEATRVAPNFIPNCGTLFHKDIKGDDKPYWTDLSNNKFKYTIPNFIDNLTNTDGFKEGVKFQITTGNYDLSINEVFENGSLYIREINIESDLESFIFDKKYSYIDIESMEVQDFHYIDKDKIFTLHHSAIQEIDRTVIALENENSELKTKVASLESELATIKQHLGI